jgi:hypothetical protein
MDLLDYLAQIEATGPTPRPRKSTCYSTRTAAPARGTSVYSWGHCAHLDRTVRWCN